MAVATDFKKRNIWPMPCRKWNSAMHTVSRHGLSAIYSVPGDVRVPMDPYGTWIALVRGPLLSQSAVSGGELTSNLEV
jgi:hypothetical protein